MNNKISKVLLTSASTLALLAAYPQIADKVEGAGVDAPVSALQVANASVADFVNASIDLPNVSAINAMNAPALTQTVANINVARATYNSLSAADKRHASSVKWVGYLNAKEDALVAKSINLSIALPNVGQVSDMTDADNNAAEAEIAEVRTLFNVLPAETLAHPSVAKWENYLTIKEDAVNVRRFVVAAIELPNVGQINEMTQEELVELELEMAEVKALYDALRPSAKERESAQKWIGYFPAKEAAIEANKEETPEVPEDLTVESVSAINETGVDLVVKVTEAIEEATVEVKNSKGEVVPVDVRPLETDDTEVTFDFTTAVKSEDLVGTWTVEGVEFDLDAVAAVNAVNDAANAVELWDALQSNYFEGAIEENIVEYVEAIAEEEPTTVDEVNEMIAKVNKEQLSDEAEAAIVKDVADAENVLQLRNALVKGNFARVNDDWITDYAKADVDSQGEMLELGEDNYFGETKGVDFEAIQDAIYAVNKTAADGAVEKVIKPEGGHLTVQTFKIADVTKARKAVEDYVKADEDNNTAKKEMLDKLELAEAIINVNTANTNARLNAALNKLAVADEKNDEEFDLELVHEDLMSDYRTTIANEANDNEVDTVLEIKKVITDVNAELGGFELDLGKDEEFIKFNTTNELDKAFTVKAVTKNGKDKADATLNNKVEIKVADKVVNKTDINLTNGSVEISGDAIDTTELSGLNKIGDIVDAEIVITMPGDEKDVVLKTKIQLVATPTSAYSTVKTDKKEYKTGDDIEVSVDLKDTNEDTVITENGKYASTITVGATTHNLSIQFKDGKATVVVPARDVTDKTNVTVAIPELSLTINSAEQVEVKADTFSKLEIKDLATTGFELFATDGINKLEVADQLINVKVEDSKGNDVKVTGADYQGNLTATVPVSGLSVRFDSPLQAEETYTITVAIGEVEATQTKTLPKEVDSTAFVKTNGELHNALGNPEVTTIVLDAKVSGAGVRTIARPITLDLNGHDVTGSLTFKYNAEGTSEIINSAITEATVNTVTVDTQNASFVEGANVKVTNLNLVDVASATYTNYGTITTANITDTDARFLNEGTVNDVVLDNAEGNVTLGGSSPIEKVTVTNAASLKVASGTTINNLEANGDTTVNNEGTLSKVTVAASVQVEVEGIYPESIEGEGADALKGAKFDNLISTSIDAMYLEEIGGENQYPVGTPVYAKDTKTVTFNYKLADLEAYKTFRNTNGKSYDVMAGVMNDFARFTKQLHPTATGIKFNGADYTWSEIAQESKWNEETAGTLVSNFTSKPEASFIEQMKSAYKTEGFTETEFGFDDFKFELSGDSITTDTLTYEINILDGLEGIFEEIASIKEWDKN